MSGDRRLEQQAWSMAFQVRIAAHAQSALARRWQLTTMLVGLPSAILAAASGVALLASVIGTTFAATLALASAVFSAALVFLNPAHQASRAALASNQYRAIDSAAMALVYDLHDSDPAEVRSELARLRDQKTRVNEAAALPPRAIWKRAEKEALASFDGAAYYRLDASLLPEELRELAVRPARTRATRRE
jgi:hypothetical protein